MAKKVYIVGAVLGTSLSEAGKTVLLSSIADGAAGVCVAFTNKKKAKKYARGKYDIIVTEVVKNED